MYLEGVARWSRRVNEAVPSALSHPATAADPGHDYWNETIWTLLSKRHRVSIFARSDEIGRHVRQKTRRTMKQVTKETMEIIHNRHAEANAYQSGCLLLCYHQQLSLFSVWMTDTSRQFSQIKVEKENDVL